MGDAEAEGTAHLETSELAFRGAGIRLAIAFQDVTSVRAAGGELALEFPGGPATFQLGPKAERWAHAIAHPKPVIDKLGVKAGMHVLVLGVADVAFRAVLGDRVGSVTTSAGEGPFDLIFLGARHREELLDLTALQAALVPNGGIWVLRQVRPTPNPDLTEMDVLNGGRAAGLVDTKVVASSATHSAMKFVIPLARRPAADG